MPPGVILLVVWGACAILGAIIGSSRNATETGLILGFLFGPLGVVATLVIDNREQCPHCGGRLVGDFRKCPHCGDEVRDPRPDVVYMPPSRPPVDLDELARQEDERRERQAEREREQQAEKRRLRNARVARWERTKNEWIAWWGTRSDQTKFLIVFWAIVAPLFLIAIGVVLFIK